MSTDKIDWILRRRNPQKNSDELITIVGQRILPQNFENSNSIEFQEYKKDITQKINFIENEEITSSLENHKDIIAFILKQLNNENCFDKEIEFYDKDILTIRIDKKQELWIDFIYRKTIWKIAKFNLNENQYLEILKGKTKPIHDKIN
ncbi:hypothetical protein [uncultured Tenacibaculum sp.]|uniref:hypothetical protein n=1 Tax=uncultured Tenacibaculum sp. TaxID=174713 RepID=UPI00262A8BE6|nr:hypothetical protein [uncultured Tenacibaculum sp.]